MFEEPPTWISVVVAENEQPPPVLPTVVVEVNVLFAVFGSTFTPLALVAVTVAVLVNEPLV